MKTSQLQIRLSPAQKAYLRRRAEEAGEGLSAYVLARVAPDAGVRFEKRVQAVRTGAGGRFALAALHDFLADCPLAEFEAAVAVGPGADLALHDQNVVAAMVEHAAALKGATPPPWAHEIAPLASPWFATNMRSLRAHLLRTSPTAFRRRNLFVDASVGQRV